MRRAAFPLVVAGFAVAFCAAQALADGPVYDIGTLTFRGAAVPVAPTYDAGTLVFHGNGAPPQPVVYNIGTLRFAGNPKPKATTIDLGKIFGKPSGTTDTAPVTPPAQQNAPLSKYRLKLLGRQPADPPPSTLH